MPSVPQALIALLVFAGVAVLLGYAVRVCAQDAMRRGKSPWLVTIAAIFFFPWGLIAWLLFRPEPLDGSSGPKGFRLEDHRVQ
jgi:hypothetical protein